MTNNKDILFSIWYDSLEGTKSQGFAYKAWCAGWEAALAQNPLDIADRAYFAGKQAGIEETLAQPEQEPAAWMGITDNPYCDDADCNDPNGRAMRWHKKLLYLRKQEYTAPPSKPAERNENG